jgi:hypothetical protein
MQFDPDIIQYILHLLPVLGYAEIHYRLGKIPSILYQQQPEIILDVPGRIEPGEDLPVVLIVKDAHNFPIELKNVSATITYQDARETVNLSDQWQKIREHYFYRLYWIPNARLPAGIFEIDLSAKYIISGREKEIHIDNYIGSSKKPFRVFNSGQKWPMGDNWYAGDIHNHSDATDDYVEFGAPVEVYHAMAQAIGLTWLTITDHSYDLDDKPGKFYAPDRLLARWKKLRDEADISNRQGNPYILVGEEISCGNIVNNNVHLLGINIREFIPGSGDSAEHWFYNAPSLTVRDAIKDIISQGGLAVAAHPGEEPLLFEKILLNRGPWRLDDFINEQPKHLQIFNGRRTDSFYAGIKLWKQLLLKGKRKYVLAGSDSHGNFNRSRQIRIPFAAMKESNIQVFGCTRTIVNLDQQVLCPNAIARAITSGNCIITDGPFISITIEDKQKNIIGPGDDIAEYDTDNCRVKVELITSIEFGSLDRFVIYYGRKGAPDEEIIYEKRGFDPEEQAFIAEINPFTSFKPAPFSYIRAEITTSRGNIGLTNPIWFRQ